MSTANEAVSSSNSSTDVPQTEAPPRTIGGILSRLGPGLIIAGSVVGSGELIATTATGAQAGFWLLWLILIGCLIKVFVQVELGRYAVVGGKTTLAALSEVPGPRIQNRGNWLVWYWFLMFAFGLAQLGGIVGGVGQALSISAPLTQYGQYYNEHVEAETQLTVGHAELLLLQKRTGEEAVDVATRIEQLRNQIFVQEVISLDSLLSLQRLEATSPTGAGLETGKNSQLEVLEKARSLLEQVQDRSPEMLQLIVLLRPLATQTMDLEIVDQALQKNPDDQDAGNRQRQLMAQMDATRTRVLASEARAGVVDLVSTYLEARSIGKPLAPLDDKIWATIITALTIVMLVTGRYGFIQSFSVVLVVSFTVITVVNLCMLQSNASWGVSLQDIINGMSFRLPPSPLGAQTKALATALATFGIIGVGAAELVAYPYWCLEKGYAQFTGPRDASPEWADRARGWMRVMRWDAWCSMVIYTFATIAFYLLGAAILGRIGLDPKGSEMIRYLSVMYRPVFGKIAQLTFLFGSFAVLYSTFFVSLAGQARVFSDSLRVMGLADTSEKANLFRVKMLCGILPLVCLSVYWTGWDPQQLILASGLMQAMMLPMLAIAALFFRYRRCDARLAPGRTWDLFLWISAIGMFVAGVWAAWSKIS